MAEHLIGDVNIVASGVSDLWKEHLLRDYLSASKFASAPL